MSASSTKAWKRKEESRITRFSKRLAEQEAEKETETEGGTDDSARLQPVSPGVIGGPITDVVDGSGPDESGDDADLPEEVESEDDDDAVEGLEVVEEDKYDGSGLEVPAPVVQIVPASRFIYTMSGSHRYQLSILGCPA